MTTTSTSPTAVTPRRWWALGALVLPVLVVGLDGTILGVACRRWVAHWTRRRVSCSGSWPPTRWSLPRPGAGRDARRPLWPQEDAGRLPGRLWGGLDRVRSGTNCGHVHRRRGLLGLGGGAHAPHGARAPSGAVRRQRATAGGRGDDNRSDAWVPIGPLLGGWMLTRFDWSWVFLINLPVVGLALVAVTRPAAGEPQQYPAADRRRRCGALGGRLALLTYGVINAGDRAGVTALRSRRSSAARSRSRRSSSGSVASRRRSSTCACSDRASSPGERPSAPSSRSRCSACCSRCPCTSRWCVAPTRRAAAFASFR